ncbi:MAG: hypothetical protein JWQ11_4061 [Rhizobacter sp.]|nr:hypothetical protein [Rhizobacter sp.]
MAKFADFFVLLVAWSSATRSAVALSTRARAGRATSGRSLEAAFAAVVVAALLAGCDPGGNPRMDAPGAAQSVTRGIFDNALNSMARLKHYVVEKTGVGQRTVTTAPVRYVRFDVLSEINGGPWASIAEFDLLDESGKPLPRDGWKASADSEGANEAASYAIDGDPRSHWHTRWEGSAAPMPHTLTLDLGRPHAISGFRLLPRQDNSRNGTVARYCLFVSVDGKYWGAPVEQGTLANQADPLAERVVVFGRQPTNHSPVLEAIDAHSSLKGEPVSFPAQATDVDGDALRFSATGLPPGILIDAQTGLLSGTSDVVGQYASTVQVEDTRGAATTVPFPWSIVEPPPPPDNAVRFVRLEALSEVNGGSWTSVAEFNLFDDNGAVMSRDGWKASADSEAGNDRASSAIDGNESSLWHTAWDGESPRLPHMLTIDLGKHVVVNGFRYLPRQDGSRNGTIAQYRFYMSKDGKDWGSPVATGDFSTLGATNAEKTVYLR